MADKFTFKPNVEIFDQDGIESLGQYLRRSDGDSFIYCDEDTWVNGGRWLLHREVVEYGYRVQSL